MGMILEPITLSTVERCIDRFFKSVHGNLTAFSFEAQRQKIWTLFGLKAISPLIYFLITGMRRVEVMMYCGISVILMVKLSTGAGVKLFDVVDHCLSSMTSNGVCLLLFNLLCAMPLFFLLVFCSSHTIVRVFSNPDNQNRLGFFFKTMHIFGQQRLFYAMILCMYCATLFCIINVGGVIVNHSLQLDTAFQSISDRIITFLLSLVVWHLSYRLNPLGNKLSSHFTASFYNPLQGIIHFFLLLSFYLILFLGFLDSLWVAIFLLILGGMIGLYYIFIQPLNLPEWLLSIWAICHAGIIAVIGLFAYFFASGVEKISFSWQGRLLVLCSVGVVFIITGYLVQYHVVKKFRAVKVQAMDLLYEKKEQILFDAVQQDRYLICAAALSCGADPERVDQKGDALLHIAAWKNFPLVAHVLLKFGADCHRVNRCKLSALHIAASQLHLQMITLLLGAGARVDVQNQRGREPIHRICSNSRGSDSYIGIQCLKMLLSHGADPYKSDHKGMTAYDLAQKWNANQCMRIIEKSKYHLIWN